MPLKQKEQKVPCLQILFPKMKLWSVVSGICAVNFLLFLWMYLQSKISEQLWPCIIYKFQGVFEPDIRYRWNLQRLFLPAFLSGGWIHVITNIYGLMSTGYMIQNQFGTRYFLLTYFVSGWCGNCLSALTKKYKLTANISACTFGVFALSLSLIAQNYSKLGEKKIYTISMFGLTFLINFIGIWESNQVSAFGMLGGFLAGALFGLLQVAQTSENQRQQTLRKELATTQAQPQKKRRRILSLKKVIIALIILLSLGLFIACMTVKFEDIKFLDNVTCSTKAASSTHV